MTMIHQHFFQIEEEQTLLNELRKIEMRKKEREKKTQDLQKLITAADSNSETRRQERKNTKKKVIPQKTPKSDSSVSVHSISFASCLRMNDLTECDLLFSFL